MNPVVRTLFTSTVKAIDKKTRTVTFMGTKETIDRTGDIIRVDGWELDNFVKNPVFLWNHNGDIPSIGRVLSVTRSGQGLLFDVKFAGPEVNEFADTIFKSFGGGFLSAVSVGFIPKDIEPIFSNDGMLVGLDIKRQELLELSAVNIPAHADALAANIDKKFAGLLDLQPCVETKAVQLEDYRKTLEGTFTQEDEDMHKDLEVLEEKIAVLAATVATQDETIKSLMTLRETVDLSQKVMDTLNKSIVSLMGDKKLAQTPGSEGEGLTPNTPTADPSAMLKTLDDVLSRFKEKAFKPKEKEGENK